MFNFLANSEQVQADAANLGVNLATPSVRAVAWDWYAVGVKD